MPRTVLVVEDQAICSCAVELVLSHRDDLSVLTAVTAEQAWDILSGNAHGICALVTDLHLPGMDGFELIEKVRADGRLKDLPIVVITGSTDPAAPGRSRTLGADAFFTKPYSPARLREKLEQLLDHDWHSPK